MVAEVLGVGVVELAGVVDEVARDKVAEGEGFVGAVEGDVLGHGAVGAWWWHWLAWCWEG